MACDPFEVESCLSFSCTDESCEESDCDVYEDDNCVTCDPNEVDAQCIPAEGARGFISVTTTYYIPTSPIFYRPSVVIRPSVVVQPPVVVSPPVKTTWCTWSWCNYGRK